MASIKTHATLFGRQRTVMKITVDKRGVFHAKIPTWATAALGIDEVTAKTMEACEDAWIYQRVVFEQTLQKERKVIRYAFRIQDKEDRYCDPDGRDDLSFGVGKGVQIAVANCIETIYFNAEGEECRRSYRWANEEVEDESDMPRDVQPYPIGYQFANFEGLTSASLSHAQTIEWTPEREAWFVALCGAMDGLIAKMRELGENPKTLLEEVASGRLLTMGDAGRVRRITGR